MQDRGHEHSERIPPLRTQGIPLVADRRSEARELARSGDPTTYNPQSCVRLASASRPSPLPWIPRALKRFLLLSLKVGALACSLLLTVALSAWLTVHLAFVGRDVTVPEVTGRGAEEAQAVLEGLGLRLVVEGEKHTERQPPGVIFYQQPLPGAGLKKGRTVRVLLSLGARTMKIPRITGRELGDAEGLLQEKGLRTGQTAFVHSLEVPENHVIAQSPEGGLSAARADRIDLLVSKGPRRWRFLMPDLSGYTRERVEDLLETHGLRVGSVETRYVMGTRGGLVIGQYPPPGTETAQGSAISLVVSRDVGAAPEGSGEVTSEDLLVY